MIQNGSIVELSNNKKYIITDSSIENGSIYYLSLELDYNTELPKDDTVFFKQLNEKSLIRVTKEEDVNFLKDVFVNKFLSNYVSSDNS